MGTSNVVRGVVALLAVVTVGCSPSSDSEPSASAPPTAAATATAATAATTTVTSDDDSTATGDEANPNGLEEVRLDLPSGDVEVADDDVFVATSNGTLYWHHGLLGDDPGDPVVLAPARSDHEVERVAGVVDGAVIFGVCCDSGAGDTVAAPGPDRAVSTVAPGAVPALSPDGTRLVVVSGEAVTMVDTTTGAGWTRPLDPSADGALVPQDVIWVDEAGPTALVTVGGELALAAIDPGDVAFGDPVPIGVPEPGPNAAISVGLAGRGPNGEVAVAVDDGTETGLRVFDPVTLGEIVALREALPDGVRSVRVTQDGELLWVDGDTLWHTPAGESVPVALGAGSSAAWFAARS